MQTRQYIWVSETAVDNVEGSAQRVKELLRVQNKLGRGRCDLSLLTYSKEQVRNCHVLSLSVGRHSSRMKAESVTEVRVKNGARGVDDDT